MANDSRSLHVSVGALGAFPALACLPLQPPVLKLYFAPPLLLLFKIGVIRQGRESEAAGVARFYGKVFGRSLLQVIHAKVEVSAVFTLHPHAVLTQHGFGRQAIEGVRLPSDRGDIVVVNQLPALAAVDDVRYSGEDNTLGRAAQLAGVFVFFGGRVLSLSGRTRGSGPLPFLGLSLLGRAVFAFLRVLLAVSLSARE